MRPWFQHKRHLLPLLLLLVVEAVILFGLFPTTPLPLRGLPLLLLIARIMLASLAWFLTWATCWRRGITDLLSPRSLRRSRR
jgi:hypothetical protein